MRNIHEAERVKGLRTLSERTRSALIGLNKGIASGEFFGLPREQTRSHTIPGQPLEVFPGIGVIAVGRTRRVTEGPIDVVRFLYDVQDQQGPLRTSISNTGLVFVVSGGTSYTVPVTIPRSFNPGVLGPDMRERAYGTIGSRALTALTVGFLAENTAYMLDLHNDGRQVVDNYGITDLTREWITAVPERKYLGPGVPHILTAKA